MQLVKDQPRDPVYRLTIRVNGKSEFTSECRDEASAQTFFEEQVAMVPRDAGVFYGFGDRVEVTLESGAYDAYSDGHWLPFETLRTYTKDI